MPGYGTVRDGLGGRMRQAIDHHAGHCRIDFCQSKGAAPEAGFPHVIGLRQSWREELRPPTACPKSPHPCRADGPVLTFPMPFRRTLQVVQREESLLRALKVPFYSFAVHSSS